MGHTALWWATGFHAEQLRLTAWVHSERLIADILNEAARMPQGSWRVQAACCVHPCIVPTVLTLPVKSCHKSAGMSLLVPLRSREKAKSHNKVLVFKTFPSRAAAASALCTAQDRWSLDPLWTQSGRDRQPGPGWRWHNTHLPTGAGILQCRVSRCIQGSAGCVDMMHGVLSVWESARPGP